VVTGALCQEREGDEDEGGRHENDGETAQMPRILKIHAGFTNETRTLIASDVILEKMTKVTKMTKMWRPRGEAHPRVSSGKRRDGSAQA
jgi:hypothetical protein